MGQKVTILGAGPTGLSVAYRLDQLGYSDYRLFEASDHVGGLSASVTDPQGFIWDHGGHVMFSRHAYFDDLVASLLRDDYDHHVREAWIWIRDRFVPFPFQNNIHRLPEDVYEECLSGIVEAQSSARARGNFAQHISAVFGSGIAEHFMHPYNFKVWAHPLEMMNTGWLGDRVPNVDVDRIRENELNDRDDVSWGPNSSFKFPLLGTGMLYERMSATLTQPAQFHRRAVEVDVAKREVAFSDGTQIGYDKLVSTIPLTELVRMIPGAPPEVMAALDDLHHTSGLFVGIGVDEPTPTTKCWVYFPESDSPFYRVTYLSNYSSHMTPKPGQFSLLAEVSSSSHKPEDPETIVERTIEGMIASKLLTPEQARSKIVSRHLMTVPYSYPVPTLRRDHALSVIQPWLMSNNIYSRGRFGAWLYELGNADHSVMMGVELADLLVNGAPESLWSLPATG